jgi:hypothetical protein
MLQWSMDGWSDNIKITFWIKSSIQLNCITHTCMKPITHVIGEMDKSCNGNCFVQSCVIDDKCMQLVGWMKWISCIDFLNPLRQNMASYTIVGLNTWIGDNTYHNSVKLQ